MENQTNFLAPGSDGDLSAGAAIWRKGLVYTRRAGTNPRPTVEPGYRVAVGFKRLAGDSFAGYRDLYRRVRTVAARAVAGLTCSGSGENPTETIVCQGWRSLGEKGDIVAAFITVDLGCPEPGAPEISAEREPSEEMLHSPGGATLEELARIAPQRANEFYNEFDFTAPSTADACTITLSYGEAMASGDDVDFQPYVERAARLARDYHSFLHDLGEVRSDSFKITRREWFLADPVFVTIHICFDR